MLKMMIPAVLALAGCASQPQAAAVLTPEVAQNMSAATLCLGISTFRPGNAVVAQQEIERRGINCADHAQAVQALQQQRAQADAQATQLLLRQQPNQYQPLPIPPPIRPQQTTCTTQRVGNQLQTVCR
jgi:hypothetical protein